ncbi:beta-carotene isomerase D27, chloroplastic [Amaranthus tricolor]|uniref:beta-carotene isomerase D27, chloroplastic n=1 Tax=Amaranthus tricolor TaxID=29722 RepID=UPI0025879774|nr:beta-carotene isomerase D27, chloroplastic [Amaranthus tricolor]
MKANILNMKISCLNFPQSHYKQMHKFWSFSPFMSHKVVNVANISPNTTTYYDGWFDRIAINHLSHNLQAVAGVKIEKEGYDGLLKTCKVVSLKFNTVQQCQLCIQALERSIPAQFFLLLKTLVPQSKFTREFLALFTGLFFAWLVGPSQLKESEFNGRQEKNVVHIQKCRFLESSNCVGMCTNLCKFPTQKFIKNYLGMPVTMVPNFEDMSCDMVFGVEPPPPDEDPATLQPCFKLCKNGKRHSLRKCS